MQMNKPQFVVDGEQHDTKIIQVENREKGFQYTYLLCYVRNGSGYHNLLNIEGYRSNHLIMVCLAGSSTKAGIDPFNPPVRSELAKDLFVAIREGYIGWDQIDDDTIYTRKDYEEMKDAQEQDST